MTTELKVCLKCHLELPVSKFPVVDKASGRRRAHCNDCESARVRAYYAANSEYRVRARANSVKQAKTNPARRAAYGRKTMLKTKYGLTPEQFGQLLAAQGGKCALCGTSQHGRKQGSGHKWLEESWPVDHDHQAGHVRGLLCHPCNVQLGGYEVLLEKVGEAKLLDYLTRPSPVLALPVPPPEPEPEYRFVAELPPRYTRGTCTVCGADQHAGGLCFKHYMRQRRNGDAGPVESIPKGVLTADDVRAIRAAPAEWGAGTKLAAQYGVTVSMVSKIRKGTARQDVPQENACPT